MLNIFGIEYQYKTIINTIIELLIMGKNRHSKDRLFITATEWKTQYGGKKQTSSNTLGRVLPFNHCALTLVPYTNPVILGKKNGVIFEYDSLISFLLQYKSDPITGDIMSSKDIIKLNMSKNNSNEWECPITNKVFTDSSHIVAISTSGNVYSYNAIEELNIKSKYFIDLISGEKFTKNDIITLQDPNNLEHTTKREISNFKHLQTIRQDNANIRINTNPSNNIKSIQTTSVMKEIDQQRQLDQESGIKRKTIEEIISKVNNVYTEDVNVFLNMKPLTMDVNPGQINTDGRASSALTSTSSNLNTSNATRYATPMEIREARWKIMRKLNKKGYVQIQTSLGNLNIEIHCDIAPRTAWNFMTLCNQEYYDNTIFHRLVSGFMIQGGDPSGTGTGGKSAFGGDAFRDEFDTRILHSARGVLSMANSGMNTNQSQFFIIFRETKHLDLKHSVFGRVVGGLNVLEKLEEIGADKKEKPLKEIKILKAIVFTNPIDEADVLLEQFINKNIQSRLHSDKSNILPINNTNLNNNNNKMRKIV